MFTEAAVRPIVFEGQHVRLKPEIAPFPVLTSSSNPRVRSKRVVLGMRVTVIAEDHERRRRQCETMTRVVNAHGGLRRIEMERHPGQPSGKPGRRATSFRLAVFDRLRMVSVRRTIS